MKKSTKILSILYLIALIPAIFFSQYIFKSLDLSGEKISFSFNAYSIIGIVLNVLIMILGSILFFRFIGALAVDKAIFFSSVPLVVVYGFSIFFLAQLSTYQNQTAKTVSRLLNITIDNNYNTILWAVLISLVFIVALFFNYFLICKPVGRVEKIVNRLGDGKIKEEKIKVGGVKQFHNIEHGLNKINNNYKKKDNSLKEFELQAQKFVPKQFIKFLGKSNISQLELGNQVKKCATTMLVKLIGVTDSKNMTLEENFNFVNAYVHVISPLVRRFNGFVDKYFGEGLLAVFGGAQDALDCAHAISRAIDIKNRQNKSLPNVEIRISIKTGDVVFGVIGEQDHKIPTIVSNSVALLEKFDEVAKLISAKMLFSKSVIDSLPLGYKFAYRHVGDLNINNEKQVIFEDVEVYPKDMVKHLIKTKSAFENGIYCYSNGEYENARAYFEQVLKSNSADKCAYVYFNKSKEKGR